MKCNFHTILRPKSDYFVKILRRILHEPISCYITITAFCTTQTNQLMAYVINNSESTYENAIKNQGHFLDS